MLIHAGHDGATNARTWADGFGVWHASVPISTARRQAAAARAAIRAELSARGVSESYALRVHREHVTAHGTVIYGEGAR